MKKVLFGIAVVLFAMLMTLAGMLNGIRTDSTWPARQMAKRMAICINSFIRTS